MNTVDTWLCAESGLHHQSLEICAARANSPTLHPSWEAGGALTMADDGQPQSVPQSDASEIQDRGAIREQLGGCEF